MKQLDTKLFLFSIFLMIPITLFFEELFSGNYLNQVLLFSLPILWPGLAHGSLDLDIAKHKGIINNNFEMLLFLLIYISVPIIFFFFMDKLSSCIIYNIFGSFHFTFWN